MSGSLFKNSSGQSTVEYILLLVVVVSLSYLLLKSRIFRDVLDPDSDFISAIVKEMEYSYRHGNRGREIKLPLQNHESFYNPKEGRSRFFSSLEEYP